MTVDAYTVIAGARRRGWTEGMIARKLGLRDGQSGYGITRQDFERPPVVVVPGPPKLRAPLTRSEQITARNRKVRDPDYGLAARVKAAGDTYIATLPKQSDERRLVQQSTIFLVYSMARLTLVEIGELYGLYGDHGPARHAIKAVGRRKGQPAAAVIEEARQERIRVAVFASQREHIATIP